MVPPILPTVESALRTQVFFTVDKIGSPTPRFAAPDGVLEAARFGMTRAVRHFNDGAHDDRPLRPNPTIASFILTVCAAAQAQLDRLIAEHAERERALDATLEALDNTEITGVE